MQTILFFHLLGAGLIGSVIVLTLVSLIRKQENRYSFYAKILAFSGAYQLITGSLLGVLVHGTLLSFCARIGLYLFILVGIESLLLLKMKKISVPLPLREVGFALSFGMSFVFLTIISKVLG